MSTAFARLAIWTSIVATSLWLAPGAEGEPLPTSVQKSSRRPAVEGHRGSVIRPVGERKVNAELPLGELPVLERLGAEAFPAPATTEAQSLPTLPGNEPLRDNEAAKILLDTMKQVQPSMLQGTIFQEARPLGENSIVGHEPVDPTSIMVRCIRELETHNQRTSLTETNEEPPATQCPTESKEKKETAPPMTPVASQALRAAARELETTANTLEDQGLFEQADLLRELAQGWRVEAREAASHTRPKCTACGHEEPAAR
jgi:hypothetical protein